MVNGIYYAARFCCYFLLVLLAVASGSIFYLLHTPIIDLSKVSNRSDALGTLLVDDAGHEWARLTQTTINPVSIQQIPAHVINAFVAAEDHAFFSHSGLSIKGIIRSLLINLYYGKRVQGASTITQQLVRLLFFDTQKTFMRKIKEQLMALLMEYHCTKEQILCAYLNTAYFGAGIYGIAAASKAFWNVSVEQLSVAQAATLAGIVKSPMNYCPLLNPLSAQQRRNVILYVMHSLHLLDTPVYQEAKQAPLALVPQLSASCPAPHLKELIRQWAEQTFGKQRIYSQGLIIHTTLNIAMQQAAQEALEQQILQLRKTLSPAIDGALMTIETDTGAIKTYVGGFSFADSQFNRARAYRQLGSLFKPIVYAVALEHGYDFTNVMVDEPITVCYDTISWQPGNANERFMGPMSLAYALSHSNNIVAIKTLLAVGVPAVAHAGRRCHLPIAHAYPSLALGCIDVTLEQAVAAFNVFPNHGVYVQPHYIQSVAEEAGTAIWKHEGQQERVFVSRIADQVLRVLCLGMESLGKKSKGWIDSQACGKTGTTSESRTCFFIGSTPDYTTGVMIGCDNNQSLGNRVFAVRTAFPIWYNLHATIKHSQRYFSFDPSLKKININAFSGQETTATNAQTLEIFI